ncbi:SDR family NAD(P)-dependent oxidoreductase [Microlunatus parietis]|uniref:SDR family NAD(P)-dependent oxidoreductase n=1 Tax=Microlunatus parietis TaxID=682979 RepID=UPI0028AF4ABB|nr:SDR family NAD(P)-dependent oxidoreductase [Microlunatus parietis]
MTDSKIALITGGNRGLGRATALALAADGVDVIITYRGNADEAAGVVVELERPGRWPYGWTPPTSNRSGRFSGACRPGEPGHDVRVRRSPPPSRHRTWRRSPVGAGVVKAPRVVTWRSYPAPAVELWSSGDSLTAEPRVGR